MLFLINLDSAHERRGQMLAQLVALGLDCERIGIDFRGAGRGAIDAFVDARLPGFAFDHEALSGAEIGCWVSHLTAWTRLRDAGGVPACAVLEDDLVLDERLPEALAAVATCAAFDVTLLGTSSRTVSSRRRTPAGPFHVHLPLGTVYNTWGYVIRRAFVERFLASPPPRIDRPIDHFTGGAVRRGKPRTGVLRPAVVDEDPALGSASQIGPHTRRLDRTRLVEGTRRRLLAGRFGSFCDRLFGLL